MRKDLLIVGVSAHDRWVHNATEEHRERMDGQAPVPAMLLDDVADFLVR